MAVVGVKQSKWYKQSLRANGGETEILLSVAPLFIEELFVYLNGTLLEEGENKDYRYEQVSNKIVFDTPLELGDLVQILVIER